ncbi:MAG: arsenate reductase [Chitinophagaceae bacterium]
MIKIYGIPNCDTIKKVFDWLNANKIAFEFHDYKKESISPAKLKSWFKQVGIETIVNKRSTTWKELTPEDQAAASDPATAIAVIMKNESIIKRPVIEYGNTVVMVGFNEAQYNLKLKDL